MNFLDSIQAAVHPTRIIKGKGLAHRGMRPGARAILAVEIMEGTVRLDDLSVQQLSRLLGVGTTSIKNARRLTQSERAAVKDGRARITDFAPPRTLPDPKKQIASVVKQIGVDSALELLAAAE